MGYEVRRIATTDWPELRRLRLEALRDSPLAYLERYEESVGQPDEFWQERVARSASGGTRCTYIADAGGTFLGKAGGWVDPDVLDQVSVEVIGVYVSPGHRGTGMADELIDAVVRWARDEAKADRIGLYVVNNNDRAAAFYRRLGFLPTGHTLPYVHDPAYHEIQLALPSAV